MFSKLDEVENRYNSVQQQLQRPDVAEDQNEFRKLMKELADLEKVVSVYRHYKNICQEIEDNKQLIAEEPDEELRAMAKEELPALEDEKIQLEEQLKIALLPKDPNDDKNIIVFLFNFKVIPFFSLVIKICIQSLDWFVV